MLEFQTMSGRVIKTSTDSSLQRIKLLWHSLNLELIVFKKNFEQRLNGNLTELLDLYSFWYSTTWFFVSFLTHFQKELNFLQMRWSSRLCGVMYYINMWGRLKRKLHVKLSVQMLWRCSESRFTRFRLKSLSLGPKLPVSQVSSYELIRLTMESFVLCNQVQLTSPCSHTQAIWCATAHTHPGSHNWLLWTITGPHHWFHLALMERLQWHTFRFQWSSFSSKLEPGLVITGWLRWPTHWFSSDH